MDSVGQQQQQQQRNQLTRAAGGENVNEQPYTEDPELRSLRALRASLNALDIYIERLTADAETIVSNSKATVELLKQ
ncbi:hypothetical protein GQ42DRAFT_161979 [Ramicandelaber brevisporus]|nr:hypothetical protein GQ42DRAFT_163732 [Ramicandelaber brevisporus]KAI8871474.1 hypothetical protein GQ42DRAFT_161979 [Ramicandelaber brevisporus]